ncbi:MAG: hypothetical protein ABIN18_30465 [Pseudomonadota bacterium]
MMTENIKALITYRLEQAYECLEAASTLLKKTLSEKMKLPGS